MEKQLKRLAELARRSHHYCEDSWYSCPLSEEGCCDDSQEGCNCGADAINQEVDEIMKSLDKIDCSDCDGTGAIDSGGVTPWGHSIDIMCPKCQGSGKNDGYDCPDCPNRGWYSIGVSGEQEQCEWCWTNPNSKFSISKAL